MEGKWVRQPSSDTSIVFVHGILSNGSTCWQHDDGTYWPDLVRDEQGLESLGIYVFTYQTGFFSGSYSLSDVVDSIKEHLHIDNVFPCQRLIFLCHSMGGIVVRKFLVERAIQLVDKKVQVGLFLVASPSLGSDYADWLSLIAKLLNHNQADALRFVGSNLWLSGLDKEFKNLKEAGRLSLSGKELVEDKFVTLKKLLKKQVVAPFSGAVYFGEPYKVPGSDHFSIAKPNSCSAIQHRLFVRFVKDLLNNGLPEQAIPLKELENNLLVNANVDVDLSLAMKAIQRHLHTMRQARMLKTSASDCLANEFGIQSKNAEVFLQALIDKQLLKNVSGQRIELTTAGLHLVLKQD